MSQENVEIVQRNYLFLQSAWARVKAGEEPFADLDPAALYQSDVVIEEVADYPDADKHRGYDGLARWLRAWADIYRELEITPHEFIAAGDHVVVPTHQRFLSNSGVEQEQAVTHLFTLRDGRITYATGYRDKAKALEAAGLSE
jgi:ketosteroid isomerase-like protein